MVSLPTANKFDRKLICSNLICHILNFNQLILKQSIWIVIVKKLNHQKYYLCLIRTSLRFLVAPKVTFSFHLKKMGKIAAGENREKSEGKCFPHKSFSNRGEFSWMMFSRSSLLWTIFLFSILSNRKNGRRESLKLNFFMTISQSNGKEDFCVWGKVLKIVCFLWSAVRENLLKGRKLPSLSLHFLGRFAKWL